MNAMAEGSPPSGDLCGTAAASFLRAGSMSGAAGEQVKHPYFVRPAADEVFALAGIWGHWEGKQREVIESVAIITTSANELMQPIHDRMPVILDQADLAGWIDPTTELAGVLTMLRPFPSERMVVYPVNSIVNSARYDRSECVTKVNVDEPLN